MGLILFWYTALLMTSLPCYEILGLCRNVEQTPGTIDTAYNRLRELVNDDKTLEDLQTAYETLYDPRTRAAYITNWTPFKESEWMWAEQTDDEGIVRYLVRRTKAGRAQEWSSSDDKGRRDIKRQVDKDRKGNRDKRRGEYGYD